MTLTKYWDCFPRSHNCGVRVRHFDLTLPSFSVCLLSSLSNWTRCSSCITALSLLSCHHWVYITLRREAHIRRGNRWNNPSFDYDTHTRAFSTCDGLWVFKACWISPFSVSSLEQWWIPIIELIIISRTSKLVEHYACPFSQSMQRVTDTRNISRYRK